MLECEQGSIRISESVQAALTRIQELSLWRRNRSLNEPNFLWIDSICINQLDTAERNVQVALMPDIYSRCSDMIIWLGEQNSGLGRWGQKMSSKALLRLYDAMRKLYHSEEKVPDHFLDHRSRGWTDSIQWVERAYLLDEVRPRGRLASYVIEIYSSLRPEDKKLANDLLYYPPIQYEEMCNGASFALIDFPHRQIVSDTHEEWKIAYESAYTELVQADWFTRKWVVQEIAQTSGKRRTCLFSSGRMDLRLLTARLREMSLLNAATPLNATLLKANATPRTLLENLALYRNTRCSEPHDHIYSLLGLSCDVDWLSIDYNADVNDLFTSLARHYINEGRCLMMLALATTQRSAQDLPSWVPDWREAWQCDRSVLHENAMAIVSSEDRRLWRDTQTSPAGLSIEQTDTSAPGLKMKAWVLGSCSQTSTDSSCPCTTCKLLADDHSCRPRTKVIVREEAALNSSISRPARSTQTKRVMHGSTGGDRWSKVVLEQFETTTHQEEVLCLFPDCALAFVLLPTAHIDETIGCKTYRLEFCFQVDEEHFSNNWFSEILGLEEQQWICIV